MTRQIISVSVTTKRIDVVKAKADVLAIGVFSDGKSAVCDAVDKKLKGAIAQVRKLGDFRGEALTTAVIYTNGRIGAKRVLLVGMGPRKKANMDTIRTAAALAASKTVDMRGRTAATAVHQEMIGKKKFDAPLLGRAIAEGIHFGGYRYDEFVGSSADGKDRLKELAATIIDADAGNIRAIGKGAKIGTILGQAQSYARTIMNRPANVIDPAKLATEAQRLARETRGLTCTVLDEKKLRAKKMGGLLAVGKGSTRKPRLIVLKYTSAGGAGVAGVKKRTIGLVGKAITFDSGGISLKPGRGMCDMKFDKSGGIAVLGAMRAIAAMAPAVTVYGIIPAAENMPSGDSYRPGDIITTYSGKTVEIENTDAEGRMILCDAIHYAVRQKCDAIVDIATLTGACVVALGENMAGVMGNNDRQIKQIKAAAESTGERVWQLPCGDEFLEKTKSKIADLKNTGGKWGSACTAGAFLGAFAGDTNWVHIDMAGVGMVDGGKKFGSPGSIGFGVKLLAEYVCSHAVK